MEGSFVLSPGQAAAVEMVRTFLKDEVAILARITGFAGTGKTTCIKVLAEEFGTPIVLAPTGKASLRVTEATGLEASTIHRFLYKASTDTKTGNPVFELRPIFELEDARGTLVVVDEASMMDATVFNDLMGAVGASGFKIILMGDTFQLPPVAKDEDGTTFQALEVPTPYSAHLSEIIRQALDSPIIRASMLLRTSNFEHEAMALLNAVGRDRLADTLLAGVYSNGVCLTHTNKRRSSLNVLAREALGYDEGTVNPGEPLLVISNNYVLDRFNGEVVKFEKWTHEPDSKYDMAACDRFTNSQMNMGFGRCNIEATETPCMISPEEISGKSFDAKIGNIAIKRASKDSWCTRYHEEHGHNNKDAPEHLHAHMGYCLTVHKSQGSEWDSALIVLEDSLSVLRGTEKRRWLYTAITRAKKSVSYCYIPKE